MAYNPIAAVSPQFRDQRGYYLKGYANGTTTPIAMAINVSGTTLLAKAEINEDGFIITPGQAIFIPYFEGSYDLYLFPTEADADNNDTANAIRIAVSGEGISSVVSQFGDEYDPTKTYVEGDIVRYEDQYWFSKVDSNAGNVPEEGSEYWRLVMDIYATPEQVNSKPNDNLLINGDRLINQRVFAGGQPAANVYGADRWKGSADGLQIEQVVENTESLDELATISWQGGTGTASVNGQSGLISGETFTLTTSGNYSVIVPTDASKIKLEYGNTATPYQARPIAEELALCQRYYEVATDSTAGVATAQYSASLYASFKVTKRVAPSITLLAPTELSNAGARTVNEVTTFGCKAFFPASGQWFITQPFAADAEIY